MIIVPFLPVHLKGLELQAAQSASASLLIDQQYAEILAHGGEAFTGFHESEVIGCAGILHLTDWRSQAWALFSPKAGRHMSVITRHALAFFRNCKVPRLETPVKTDFNEGHRWMRILGFRREGTMKGYALDGDYDLYARLQSSQLNTTTFSATTL